MKPDLELESWREQWQTATEIPADLRRKVERGSRNMRLMVAMELLVTVAIGGGSALLAVRDPRVSRWVLAGAVWVFLLAAWTFALVNRRGNWRAEALSTADFVDLSIRRAQGKLASSRFGVVLYFAEMAFCLTWLYWDPAQRQALPAIIFAVVTPAFLVGLARYRRAVRRELAELMELRGR